MARATSSLPVPLSPVISTVRSLPCSRWICSTTRAHRGAGARGIPAAAARAIGRRRRRPSVGGSVAGRAQREALARHGGDHPHAPHDRVADRPRRGEQHEARAVRIAAEPLDDRACRGRRTGPDAPRAPARAPCRGRIRRRRRARARRRPAAPRRRWRRPPPPLRPAPRPSRGRADRAAPPHPRSAAPSHRRHRPAR